MITYAWKQRLDERDAEEILTLLKEAGTYDEEAGFSTALLDASDNTHFLVVAMPPQGQRESVLLDRLPDVRVVAFLRVDVVDGWGMVQFVVRPDFRSLGLATLLFERLRDEPEGWAAVPGLEGIRAWAHGSHPAAERMKVRFGAALTSAVAKTVRSARRAPDRELPVLEVNDAPVAGVSDVVAGHSAGLAPADSDVWSQPTTKLSISELPGTVYVALGEDGPGTALLTVAGVDDVLEGDLRALVEHGFRHAIEAGASEVRLYVDALDEVLVRVARLLEFEHDQSDLLYTLAAPSGPPGH